MLSTQNRTPWRAIRWGTIAAILAAPAIAMQFTAGMAWDAADFALLALLLGGAGLIFEIAATQVRTTRGLAAVAGVLGFGVLFVWADAAVGVL